MQNLCFIADMGSQNPVNFTKLAAAEWNGAKCVAVILRATRSNGQIDPLYAQRLTAVIAAGFLPGAYGFNTGETAAIQADRLIKTTSPDVVNLFRALDLERNPSGGQMTLAMVVEYLDRVDQKFGRYTGLYSGDRIKSLIVKATSSQRDFLAAHPLWGCEYGERWKNVDVNGHQLPWLNGPTIWQRTGDGVGPEPHTFDGLQAGADLSTFEGTREELASVWAGLPLKGATLSPPSTAKKSWGAAAGLALMALGAIFGGRARLAPAPTPVPAIAVSAEQPKVPTTKPPKKLAPAKRHPHLRAAKKPVSAPVPCAALDCVIRRAFGA